MSMRVLAIACVIAIALGIACDETAAQVGPPPPPPVPICDQNCRMRTQFQMCASGTCYMFSASDCLLCVVPVGTTNQGQCLPRAGDPLFIFGTCTITSNGILMSTMSTCTLLCPCGGFDNVEANLMGTTITATGWDQYTCQ